jgi:hypothetical protein
MERCEVKAIEGIPVREVTGFKKEDYQNTPLVATT